MLCLWVSCIADTRFEAIALSRMDGLVEHHVVSSFMVKLWGGGEMSDFEKGLFRAKRACYASLSAICPARKRMGKSSLAWDMRA